MCLCQLKATIHNFIVRMKMKPKDHMPLIYALLPLLLENSPPRKEGVGHWYVTLGSTVPCCYIVYIASHCITLHHIPSHSITFHHIADILGCIAQEWHIIVLTLIRHIGDCITTYLHLLHYLSMCTCGSRSGLTPLSALNQQIKCMIAMCTSSSKHSFPSPRALNQLLLSQLLGCFQLRHSQL